MILNVLLNICLCVIVVLASNKCSDTARSEIENHLSTKTPYRVIANKDDRKIEFPGCQPIRIWSVIRHGSRNPSRKVIRKAKDNLMTIRENILASQRTKLCPHELAMFRNWNFDVDENHEKFLVYEGEDELIELAERMQRRLRGLLTDSYSPDLFKFKYTATQRTLKSAESFAIGLFGRHKIKNITYPEALHKDPVLRFYKLCNRWKAEVDKNPDALIEVKKFTEGSEMQHVINAIKNRTGIKRVTPKDVHLMYTICAFETAWNKQRISPWCALFDRHTIRILEFIEDLEYYWIDGYGYELTSKQACPAIIDMINHIDPHSHEPNATFYFTHSGTILKLLSHLRLYQDDFVLTHADYARPRNWKSSKIDAFASNLAFVTFKCENDYKVLSLHQERVVHLPGCPQNENLCQLETLKRTLKSSIENCNFNEICDVS